MSNKKETTTEIKENLDAAPFDTQTTVAVEEKQYPTFDELIKTELRKYDDVMPKIEELKQELMPLTISSGVIKDKDKVLPADKDGYEKVSKAIRFIVSKRTAVEDKRKELKADSLAYGRAVDARAKEITELISPIETHLKAQKQQVDDEIAIVEAQLQQEKQRKLQERHLRLVNAGMTAIANTYIWNYGDETHELLAINLETMDDKDFEAEINKVIKLENDKQEKIKQEEERKAEEQRLIQEQQEAVRKQQQEEQEKLRIEQEKLQKEQDAINKQLAEMAKMKQDLRLQVLQGIGCQLSEMTGFIFYKNKNVISLPELSMIEDWDSKLQEIKNTIKQTDESIIAEEAKKQQEAFELAAKKIDEQKEAERLKKEQEEAAEKERIANLSDKQKFAEYVAKLVSVEAPEFKTAKWTSELKKMIQYFQQYQ